MQKDFKQTSTELCSVISLWIQVILEGMLTGIQGDIRCKVLEALSTVK